jgi:hypothetical protein
MIRFVFSFTNALERFFTMSIQPMAYNRFASSSPQQSRSNPKVTQQREGVLMDGSLVNEILGECATEGYVRGFGKEGVEELSNLVSDQVINPLLLSKDSFWLESIIKKHKEKRLLFSTLLHEKDTHSRKLQDSIMTNGDYLFAPKEIVIPTAPYNVQKMLVNKKTNTISFDVPLFPHHNNFEKMGQDILQAIRWYQTQVYPEGFEDMREKNIHQYQEKINGWAQQGLLYLAPADHVEEDFKKLESSKEG